MASVLMPCASVPSEVSNVAGRLEAASRDWSANRDVVSLRKKLLSILTALSDS